MPLNSKTMLAPVSLGIRQVDELVRAEQPELELILAHIQHIIEECSINSSTELLGRYEKIFGLQAGDKSVEDRRAALLLYLNARLIITPDYLAQLVASIVHIPCTIEEDFPAYTFTVTLAGEVGHGANFADAGRYIKMLKPAHLAFRSRVRYTFPLYLGAKFKYGRTQYRLAGTFPQRVMLGRSTTAGMELGATVLQALTQYELTGENLQAGTKPYEVLLGLAMQLGMELGAEFETTVLELAQAGEQLTGTKPTQAQLAQAATMAMELSARIERSAFSHEQAGRQPDVATIGKSENPGTLEAGASATTYEIDYPPCGTKITGL